MRVDAFVSANLLRPGHSRKHQVATTKGPVSGWTPNGARVKVIPACTGTPAAAMKARGAEWPVPGFDDAGSGCLAVDQRRRCSGGASPLKLSSLERALRKAIRSSRSLGMKGNG